MRIRRTLPVVLVVVVVAAAVTLAVQLRKLAPPEAARLLPGADAFFYANLSWARRLNGGKDLPAVSHDPEYERFIQQTGFQFERDLDEAAFAVHYPGNRPAGGTGGSAPEMRFSEVLVGRFHGERLTGYLRQIARSIDTYHSVEIFTIPVESRLLRVAVLSADSVAASNHDDPAVIQGIVDRSKRLASPFGGPAFLRQYYRGVQLGSLSWVIAKIDPAAPETAEWSAVFTKPATVVISGSLLSPLYLHVSAVHLRAEAFTGSGDEAAVLADKLTAFIALTRSAEISVGTHGTDADVKALFDSVKVRQDGDHAVVTAAMPLGFLHKMLAGPPPELNEPAAMPPQSPAQPNPSR
jgi:hypothetical protein